MIGLLCEVPKPNTADCPMPNGTVLLQSPEEGTKGIDRTAVIASGRKGLLKT